LTLARGIPLPWRSNPARCLPLLAPVLYRVDRESSEGKRHFTPYIQNIFMRYQLKDFFTKMKKPYNFLFKEQQKRYKIQLTP
jgi:hypothetical protein